MKRIKVVLAVGTAVIVAGACAAAMARQSWMTGTSNETPLGDRWWPHPLWGAEDEAGATNWYTKPDVVLRASQEIDKGMVYSLGFPYEKDMPLFGNRAFDLRIPGGPTGGPFGDNHVVWNDEFLATEIGQVGTQFDGLGHIGSRLEDGTIRYYNGFTAPEVNSAYGLKKLGTEKLHPIFARAFLIDVAGAKGVAMLDKGYEITMADVRAALARQNMSNVQFAPGDAFFFYTGWSTLWKKDNARFTDGCPGIGMEVARWLSDEVKAGIVGADTWATEVHPNPDAKCVFCVHSHLLTRHGIVNQENMRLDDLVKQKVYRFAYAFNPAPIVGATGSIGAPIAID